MAANPAQPKIVPIEEFIFEGLRQRVSEVFQVRTINSNSSDEIQLLNRLKDTQQLEYPYAYFSLSAVSVAKETYRSHSMYRTGLNTQLIDRQGTSTYNIKLLPTDFVFEVRYVDNDFRRLIGFSKKWLFSSQAGFLKFSIDYGQSIDIALILEESINIPKREADPTNVQEYELTTQLTVRGYTSQEQLVPQGLVKEIEVELATTDSSGQSSVFLAFPIKKSTV